MPISGCHVNFLANAVFFFLFQIIIAEIRTETVYWNIDFFFKGVLSKRKG